MSIQSTASHNAKPDLLIGREVSFSSVEKQMPENSSLPSDQEILTPPKFGTILSNLNERQSHSPASEGTCHNAQCQNNPFWNRHGQDSYPASDYSLVNQQDVEFDEGQSGEQVILQTDMQPHSDQESTTKVVKESEDAVMPISLDGLFIQDTLEGINTRQNFAFDVMGEPTPIKAILSSIESLMPGLNPPFTQPIVHIEVQAAPIEYTNLMTDQQQQAIVMGMEEDVPPTITPELLNQKEEQEGEEWTKNSTSVNAKAVKETLEGDQTSSFEKKNRMLESQKDQQATSISLSKIVKSEAISSLQTSTPTSTYMPQPMNANSPGNQISMLGSNEGQFHLESTSVSGSLARSNLDKVNTLMQVKDHFQSMLKNQQTYLKVNLIPKDLGGIEITIDLSKETVMATLIRAERRETMELLARYAEDINKLFHDAGLQANLADMNFSSQQDLPQELQAKTSVSAESPIMETQEEQVLQDDIDPDALVDIKA